MNDIKQFTKKELKGLVKEKNLLEFNRDISDIHTKKMVESVIECGILRLPVIGDVSSFDQNKKYVIIDGQHLCNAIVKLPKGIYEDSVPCIVKVYKNKRDVISDISKLNNTQKTWNDENYLDAWFKFGKDNVEHFTNYSYLWNAYNHSYDGLPCGFLVDLFATSKDSFAEEQVRLDDDFTSALDDLVKISGNKKPSKKRF